MLSHDLSLEEETSHDHSADTEEMIKKMELEGGSR
jgi:hypothetical protein